MKDIFKVINELKNTKGTNAKAAILTANKDVAGLADYLKLVYEPRLSYYLTSVNLAEPTDGGLIDIDKLKELATKLDTREISGFKAAKMLTETSAFMDAEEQALFTMMIKRDLKAGFGPASINKVFPGLITLVPYRRCVLPKDSNIKNWAWGQPGFYAYSQLKADGSYANVDVTPSGVAISTRAGSIYPTCAALVGIKCTAAIIANKLGYDGGTQLQGELLVYHKGVMMPRAEGNGILNSIQQTGEDPGTDYQVVLIAWDAIPLSEVVPKGKGSMNYDTTFTRLSSAIAATNTEIGNTYNNSVRLVHSRIVRTYDEAMAHFIELTSADEEGTIIKHKDAHWIDGDDDLQVKGKLEVEVELIVVGFKEGDPDGKHADTFGSILMQSSEGMIEVGVTGLSDEFRRKIWENRDDYLGKIATVRFNHITYSKDLTKEKHSLFLPRLVEFRADKTEADSFQRIVDQYEAAKKGN